MSVKELSQANSASKSQRNYRKLRKFTFTDLTLSFQVRKRLYELIISFDDNVNYEFEKQQIRKALIQILDESQAQIAYVINNVFRYDCNHDGVVTYEQFSNFCLEQHFGEMAIQRLHKIGVYGRGKQRMMSQAEFIKTIEYCLSFISIKPTNQSLKTIFKDIDLDKDGYISYVDYFVFLKQYFGSQSQSATEVTVSKVQQDLKKTYANIDRHAMKQQIFKEKKHFSDQNKIQAKLKQKPIAPIKPIVPVQISTVKIEQLKSLGQRISRLIYHQLKITTMQHDHQMLLCSSEQNAQQLLINQIKIPQYRARQIISQAFQRQQTISYEKLLKFAVQCYMCEDVINTAPNSLNKQKYVNQIISNLYFVKAKPFIFLLQELFDKFNEGKNRNQITKNEFKELMGLIFNSYTWPRKTGELRVKQPLIPRIQNHKFIRN